MRRWRSQSETANWPRACSKVAVAVVLVEVDPGLGVAAGGQVVAAGQERLAELGVVEELAVEGDPDGAVLVGDRLAAAGEVDDGEPSGAQGEPGLAVVVLVVGPAVGDGGGHGAEPRGGELARTGQVQGSGNPAHRAPVLLHVRGLARASMFPARPLRSQSLILAKADPNANQASDARGNAVKGAGTSGRRRLARQ